MTDLNKDKLESAVNQDKKVDKIDNSQNRGPITEGPEKGKPSK